MADAAGRRCRSPTAGRPRRRARRRRRGSARSPRRSARRAARPSRVRVGIGSNVSKAPFSSTAVGDLGAADVEPDEAPVAHRSSSAAAGASSTSDQLAGAGAHERRRRRLVRRRAERARARRRPCRRRRRGTRPRARVLNSGSVSVTRGTSGSMPASGTPTTKRWLSATRRLAREQRGGVAVRAEPHQREVEPRVAADRLPQQRLVGGGRRVGAERGVDRHQPRAALLGQAVGQRGSRTMRRFERSSSGGTTRSSPSQSVAALRSASLCDASS